MKKVVIALFMSVSSVGCSHVVLSTPPTSVPKLPCSVVMEETDQETGKTYLGLLCDKDGMVLLVEKYHEINAWQKDAWQKCGPKDGKESK